MKLRKGDILFKTENGRRLRGLTMGRRSPGQGFHHGDIGSHLSVVVKDTG